MKHQKGFSLVELLVVVIIIGIIAAIAIPSLLASRRAANEASAISSLRTIHSAQLTYFSTTGGNLLYAPDLPALKTAGLIDAELGGAGGVKSGYTFVSNTGASGSGVYCATGEPNGTNGTNHYGVSQNGAIYKDTATIDCTAAGVMTLAATSVAIQ